MLSGRGVHGLAGRGDEYPLNTDLDWGLSSNNNNNINNNKWSK